MKEEEGRRETSFVFHQLRKLMETNSNNNELCLHDHTSTYSIAKAVFRNQSYNIGTAKNLLFSGNFTERLMYWKCRAFTIRFLISEFAWKTRRSQLVNTRRKTWLNSALSLVKRKFYQTVNVRKISRSWLVFPLGQLGIYHQLTEGKCAVRVTFSSTWKTGLNSSFSLVNRKFYHKVNVVKILRSWLLFRLRITQGKLNIHRPVTWPGKHAVHFTSV